ncbi:flagellar hook-length control protein FliK [Limimaricola variabilis]|uniref:flagellar hook-length control protein FliK n=1 Tax=Limimaricola variabilis TaxID=1492771 RepID=UPI002AC8F5F9|nr:flagellar hook-length control protein FliK [Limimaricola variabilis]WPY94899.1 flagellar hook-length control protein FliK [Limimaricola variabilis]
MTMPITMTTSQIAPGATSAGGAARRGTGGDGDGSGFGALLAAKRGEGAPPAAPKAAPAKDAATDLLEGIAAAVSEAAATGLTGEDGVLQQMQPGAALNGFAAGFDAATVNLTGQGAVSAQAGLGAALRDLAAGFDAAQGGDLVARLDALAGPDGVAATPGEMIGAMIEGLAATTGRSGEELLAALAGVMPQMPQLATLLTGTAATDLEGGLAPDSALQGLALPLRPQARNATVSQLSAGRDMPVTRTDAGGAAKPEPGLLLGAASAGQAAPAVEIATTDPLAQNAQAARPQGFAAMLAEALDVGRIDATQPGGDLPENARPGALELPQQARQAEAAAPLRAPTPAAPPPPPSGFSRALTAQIREAGVVEGHTRISLTPGGLGEIEIDLAQENGQMRVVIRAENQAVLQALRGDRDGIAALLGDAGGLDDGQLSFESFARGDDRDDDGGKGRRAPSQGVDGAETAEAALPDAVMPSLSTDRLDIIT